MKQSMYWDLKIDALGSSKSCFFSREEIIKEIQLDAMKEGAKMAAEQLDKCSCKNKDCERCSQNRACIKTILTTAEQWTINDL